MAIGINCHQDELTRRWNQEMSVDLPVIQSLPLLHIILIFFICIYALLFLSFFNVCFFDRSMKSEEKDSFPYSKQKLKPCFKLLNDPSVTHPNQQLLLYVLYSLVIYCLISRLLCSPFRQILGTPFVIYESLPSLFWSQLFDIMSQFGHKSF